MVFFQPTFHKYFLEQAKGLNPHLAYSFFRYNWTHLFWFLPPHLPRRGKGSAALLSCGTGAVINHVWISLLQVSEALSRSFLPKLLSSHTPGKFLYTLHSPSDVQQPTPFTTLHSPTPKVILWKWTTPSAVEKIIWKISSERILVQENTKKRLESLTAITDHCERWH